MSGLLIHRCSPMTTIQDGGRTGYLRFGVSESGPMDWVSHHLANRLVGNSSAAAAIEFGMGGLEVEAVDSALLLAIVSTGMTSELDNQIFDAPVRLTLKPGQRLKLTINKGGLWGYLAIRGAFTVSPILASLATNHRTGLGPQLAKGLDLMGKTLALETPKIPQQPPSIFEHPLKAQHGQPIRLIPGPQDDMFAEDQRSALVSNPWQISARLDRMGYRLEGSPLTHARGSDIVSDGIALGAVQIPGDGLPTILMADRQPTGGYPKIATVIRADLPRLAQSPPGTKISFAWTDIRKAVASLKTLTEQLASPRSAGARALSSEYLLANNLIDGAIAETPES